MEARVSPNAMIVWLHDGVLRYCEATMLPPSLLGGTNIVFPTRGKVLRGTEAMQAAMARLDRLRMEELGITGEDLAETRAPNRPKEL